MSSKTLQITVTGLVQGVGFRPFVFRIASRLGLSGWVQNTNENVKIIVSGTPVNIQKFLISLREETPPAAMIDEISVLEIQSISFPSFTIHNSHDISNEITEISPDIAVCEECLCDIDQPGHRHDYPFVNCTNCGPRFTIIEDLPYDRAKTTMKTFTMCPSCRKEYETVTDRRFHAQPTACSNCGPQYELFTGNKRITREIFSIVNYVSHCIDDGGIVLIKGLGGMHLACDASMSQLLKDLGRSKTGRGNHSP